MALLCKQAIGRQKVQILALIFTYFISYWTQCFFNQHFLNSSCMGGTKILRWAGVRCIGLNSTEVPGEHCVGILNALRAQGVTAHYAWGRIYPGYGRRRDSSKRAQSLNWQNSEFWLKGTRVLIHDILSWGGPVWLELDEVGRLGMGMGMGIGLG